MSLKSVKFNGQMISKLVYMCTTLFCMGQMD